MPESQLTGVRIRDRRLDKGISQTELAKLAGISPSYLNLIEHNRRRIAGKVLNAIARALELEASVLTEVAEPALLEALDLAAASAPESGAEQARAREFADRFPGWAATVASQTRRVSELEERVAALSDRLAHDQHLDRSLHEVISVVSSIRSTASILASAEALDEDWQSRFHQNLHGDSLRLAEASQALATYLDAPKEQDAGRLTAVDVVEQLFDDLGHHIAVLEALGGRTSAAPDNGEVEAAIAELLRPIATPQARALGESWLRSYVQDVTALPMPRLVNCISDCGYDPGAVAEVLGLPLPLVMRRMAALPAGAGHPPIGYAVCDAAGGLIRVKSVSDFALPRAGTACPLWPLYRALTRPGAPVKAVVAMPGAAASRMTCYALAEPVGPVGFDIAPVYQSVMLVVSDAPLTDSVPVGRTCRVCPRADCKERREPSILHNAPEDHDDGGL